MKVIKKEISLFDEWSGLADLLANLIEKYASDLDIGDMPDVAVKINMENNMDEADNMKQIKQKYIDNFRKECYCNNIHYKEELLKIHSKPQGITY